MTIEIRPARGDEGERLKEIALSAKGSWGYEPEAVARWADQGDFSARRLAELNAFVAVGDGRAVGWCSLFPKDGTWWLEDLWVESAWFGKGVGAALFRHAVAYARSCGGRCLEWEAEPNAAGFYERMGARYVRDGKPSAWGRIIPIMRLDVGD